MFANDGFRYGAVVAQVSMSRKKPSGRRTAFLTKNNLKSDFAVNYRRKHALLFLFVIFLLWGSSPKNIPKTKDPPLEKNGPTGGQAPTPNGCIFGLGLDVSSPFSLKISSEGGPVDPFFPTNRTSRFFT